MLNVMFSCVLRSIELGRYTIRVMYQEGHRKVKDINVSETSYDVTFAVINNENRTISYVDNNIDWFDHCDENVLGAAKMAMNKGMIGSKQSLLVFLDYLGYHMGEHGGCEGLWQHLHYGEIDAEDIIDKYVYPGAMNDYTVEELNKLPELPYGTKWNLYPEVQDELSKEKTLMRNMRLEFDRAVHMYNSGRYKQEWTSLRQRDGRLPEEQEDGPKYRFNLGGAEGGES